MNRYSIAVIPGDGIGKEVVPAALQVIEAAGKRFGFSCDWQNFDWGCERFASEGAMMPENGLEQLRLVLALKFCVGFQSFTVATKYTNKPLHCAQRPQTFEHLNNL